jgi:hypothetical protein
MKDPTRTGAWFVSRQLAGGQPQVSVGEDAREKEQREADNIQRSHTRQMRPEAGDDGRHRPFVGKTTVRSFGVTHEQPITLARFYFLWDSVVENRSGEHYLVVIRRLTAGHRFPPRSAR